MRPPCLQVLPRNYADARTYNMLVSVCVAARDLKGALAAADMFESTGGRLDTMMYTNLITAAASVGDTTQAFLLYSDMHSSGVKVDRHVVSARVACCCRAIARVPDGDRRGQLVLLERAATLVEEARKVHNVDADAAVWNALINAAGRAGQLERALQVRLL